MRHVWEYCAEEEYAVIGSGARILVEWDLLCFIILLELTG